MHSELVEKKRWIAENRFLHALNFCMLLPGPEATQLATYIGWLLHGAWGGIVAGALFVLPSVFILWLLSFVHAQYGQVAWVASIFYGIKPAVVAIVAIAVIRVGKRALKNSAMWSIAAAAFVAIYFLRLPFPLIVFSAALLGLIGGRFWNKHFVVLKAHDGSQQGSVIADDSASPSHAAPSWSRLFKVTAVSLAVWWLPVFLVGWWLGRDHAIFREGIFFSKAAMVTFGGAYAVLPYVSQQAVENYHWLNTSEMMDGLGLAETTPGPLIMVLQFVGFLGAWHHPGVISPLLAGTLGAFLTTWTTFVPCFLWILAGAPYIERLRGQESLTAALSAVTAAVVGVVLNLAVWFALNVFLPATHQVDWFAVAVAAVIFCGMFRWKWDIVRVVLGSGLLGLLWKLISGS